MRKKRQKKSYAAIPLTKFLSNLRLISNLKLNPTEGGYNTFIIGENTIINGLWSDNDKFYISSAYGIDRVTDDFVSNILEKHELPSKTKDVESEMNYYQIMETKKGELK